jgi:hypothetical protein
MPDEESEALEGENLETTHWEDAHHWMSTYADLLEFNESILESESPSTWPSAPVAAEGGSGGRNSHRKSDGGYEETPRAMVPASERSARPLARSRDSNDSRRDREATLTSREFQLLHFLLDHPGRYFSVDQILREAWAETALFPEEVRNYVQRVRKVLVALDVPCSLINRPSRGYSLQFRVDK